MDLEHAQGLLGRCTYKAGYNHYQVRICVKEFYSHAVLEVRAKVPDTHKPGSEPGDIILTMGIPQLEQILDDEFFLAAVARAFEEFERHECREGFRFDGIIWSNPHLQKQEPIEGIRA